MISEGDRLTGITALVALIIGLLTLRKMLKEKHERP